MAELLVSAVLPVLFETLTSGELLNFTTQEGDFPDKTHFLEAHRNTIRTVVSISTEGADAELIDKMPKLKIVSSFGVGKIFLKGIKDLVKVEEVRDFDLKNWGMFFVSLVEEPKENNLRRRRRSEDEEEAVADRKKQKQQQIGRRSRTSSRSEEEVEAAADWKKKKKRKKTGRRGDRWVDLRLEKQIGDESTDRKKKSSTAKKKKNTKRRREKEKKRKCSVV
ncbi:hypothetical protein Dsin_010006 [Dipteronia sinensis]|uniref:Uncharacterized protein n=1 Tax=Dipteronia sinensis TaxID=43782 RepID=A0AAE0EC99_9ROSI|nr:hypothetical protein Dsin_010006 [Dipteronia sinensis]